MSATLCCQQKRDVPVSKSQVNAPAIANKNHAPGTYPGAQLNSAHNAFTPTMICARPGHIKLLCLIVLLFHLLFATALMAGESSDTTLNLMSSMLEHEPVSPIPAAIIEHEPIVKLGERLFHDARLSSGGNLSCASCHNLNFGGTDQVAFSINGRNQATEMNTPTIFNVSLYSIYYWRGTQEKLDTQLDDALDELNTNWSRVISTLKAIPEYKRRFKLLFSDGITKSNVKTAILSFERSLLTPDSRFDRYLHGEPSAISEEEKQGYLLFKNYGCISCHQGTNMGGNLIISQHHFEPRPPGKINMRINKGKPLQQIRVPSLRNVAVTAPYFHDGSIPTLKQAVSLILEHQMGEKTSDQEVYLIVQFLNTLTGKYQGKAL